MRINTKVIALGSTLCLLAGGATTLAEAAVQSTSSMPTITGVATATPSGPAPAVNGVPVDPATGALPQGPPWSATTTQKGTIASAPSRPAPAVNGVPVDPATGAGAVPHATIVATYTGPDSRAITSGAALRHQVRLTCLKSLTHVRHKRTRIAPACR